VSRDEHDELIGGQRLFAHGGHGGWRWEMRRISQSAHVQPRPPSCPTRYAAEAGNLTEKFILTSQSFQSGEAAAESGQNAADRQEANSACRKALAPAQGPPEADGGDRLCTITFACGRRLRRRFRGPLRTNHGPRSVIGVGDPSHKSLCSCKVRYAAFSSAGMTSTLTPMLCSPPPTKTP
jgi:hypothetical protein